MSDDPEQHKNVSKPILKTDDKPTTPKIRESVSWDEQNILKTFHPAEKDYGHMKIDEPKTPYEREVSDEPSPGTSLNPTDLINKLQTIDNEKKIAEEKKASFKEQRKKHYNEGEMLKKLRQSKQPDDEDPKQT